MDHAEGKDRICNGWRKELNFFLLEMLHISGDGTVVDIYQIKGLCWVGD